MERLLDKEDDGGCIEIIWKDLKLLLKLYRKGKLDRMNREVVQISLGSVRVHVSKYLTVFLPVRKVAALGWRSETLFQVPA
jgi:hypothetical protein